MSTISDHPNKQYERNTVCLEAELDITVPLEVLTPQLDLIIDELAKGQVNALMLTILAKKDFFAAKYLYAMNSQNLNRWERSIRRLERMPVTIIGLFSGELNGPASDLLSVSDYRFATSDFALTFPSVDGVICPGMFLYRLTKQLGQAPMRRFIFENKPITSEQAMKLGIIDEISTLTSKEKSRIKQQFERFSGQDISIRRMLISEASASNIEEVRGTYLAAYEKILR